MFSYTVSSYILFHSSLIFSICFTPLIALPWQANDFVVVEVLPQIEVVAPHAVRGGRQEVVVALAVIEVVRGWCGESIVRVLLEAVLIQDSDDVGGVDGGPEVLGVRQRDRLPPSCRRRSEGQI